jgi:ankyrin repeat protein
MTVARSITVTRLSLLICATLTGCMGRANSPPTLETQLLHSARKGDTESVRQLLKRGARIEAKDQERSTPLALAVDYAHLETAKLLLDKGADPVAGGLGGDSDLVNGASQGNFVKVQLLLERGASSAAKDEALFKAAETAIAVVEGAPPDNKWVIQNEKENGVSPAPSWGETARVLLDHGANIAAEDEERATPLMRAAEHGQTEVVRVLLEKGATVDARDKYGATSLIGAACECAIIDMPATLDSMKLLIYKGANVNTRTLTGGTALMAAASAGRTENVALLLDRGALVDARDDHGNTALMIAAAGSGIPSADTVKLLLARGADIQARNKSGDTALILAAGGGGYEDASIVQLLLSKGANIRARNNQGRSALDMASKNHRAEIVPLLKTALSISR